MALAALAVPIHAVAGTWKTNQISHRTRWEWPPNKMDSLRQHWLHLVRSKDDYIILFLLLVSLCLNVVLGLQLSAKRFAQRLPARQIVSGTRITALRVRALDGTVTTLEWQTAKKASVVYVFTPNCHWCKQNLENVRVLAAAREDAYRFIGLSLTETNLRDYCRESNISFPVYTLADRQTIKDLHLGATPDTFVVSSSGEVTFATKGAYAGKAASDVERFFGIRLPGLVANGPRVTR